MKIQLDSIKFCREIRAALKDDRTAVKWLRSFYETLLFEGTIEDGLPSVKAMFVEADGYKAMVAYQKLFNSFKRKMEGASDKEIRDAMVARRGDEIARLEERIELRKNLMAGDDGREDADEVQEADTATEQPTEAASLTSVKPDAKHPHGEFKNVMLTDDEYARWIMSGSDADALVEELSSYLASSGKRYKNHYATLLNWRRRKTKDKKDAPKSFAQQDADRRNFQLTHSIFEKVAQ